VLLSIICLQLWAQENGIVFQSDSLLSQALTKAKTEHKLVFLDCTAKWCGPCRFMLENVFPNKEVGDFFNSKFVSVKMDIDTQEGKRVFEQFGGGGVPTFLFLNEQGELVHVATGGRDGAAFIELGKTALDPTKRVTAYQEKIKAGDKSVKTLTTYFDMYFHAPQKDSLINEYFNSISDNEKFSEDSWNLFRKHVIDIHSAQFQFVLKSKEAFYKKFGEQVVRPKLVQCFSFYNNRHDDNQKEATQTLQSMDSALFTDMQIQQDFYEASRTLYDDSATAEMWKVYVQKTEAYVQSGISDPMEINNICWAFYAKRENSNVRALLPTAKKWSLQTVQAQPNNHFFSDTYAHILFALGEVAEAIKYEEIALQKATEEKADNANFYKDEIQRYKASLNK
jgi:thioredoxin-related protein